MKILTPGHRYVLDNFEQKDQQGQTLQFIEKRVTEEGEPAVAGQLITVHDGTTNEEVLAMLIDRLEFLYAKMASVETATAIVYCRGALDQLEKRTRNRKERGVEGTHQA